VQGYRPLLCLLRKIRYAGDYEIAKVSVVPA